MNINGYIASAFVKDKQVFYSKSKNKWVNDISKLYLKDISFTNDIDVKLIDKVDSYTIFKININIDL